jgi:hypothetical protein
MEYYFYQTPKQLQKMKIRTDDIIDILCPFFNKHTNQPLEKINFDYYHYGKKNGNEIIENIKTIEANLNIMKKKQFSQMERYEIDINSYSEFIKILRERNISFNGVSIFHNFNFKKYNYSLLKNMLMDNNDLYNNIFVGIEDEKSQYVSLTLCIPFEFNIDENRQYLKTIEDEIKVKLSKKHFYIMYKNEQTGRWKSKESDLII